MLSHKKFHLLQDTKLQTKMILLVSGIVFLCVLPLSTIVYYKNKDLILEKTVDVCKTIANNIAKIADDELLVGDTFEATSSALTKLKDSGVSALKNTYIIDLDGKVVAQLHSTNLETNVDQKTLAFIESLTELTSRELNIDGLNILQFVYPIFIEYENSKIRLGTAIFEFDSNEIFLPIIELRTSMMVSSGVLFVLGIIIAFFISYTLSYPLQTLNEGAKQIGSGDFSHRILLKGKDEIGQLAIAFNQMSEKIQDFTNHLEQKVLERTEELNQSLEQIKALKEAQDGDYYLTSLLIEPLSANNNYSTFVKTEFYIEQKKKFSFRSWESQIGGDICITDTLRLQNREYTVFLNADAMGKSIQGAGGALVLGVVFNANLIRSRLLSQSHFFPEIWLKERFLDLQNVFLSFDGTMYISVCMGLIDNETGMMYYINAEHPWTVLYRDGIASFLEEKIELYKIGTPGQEDKFSVKTFLLKPGDVIITGSDGRDDVIIGTEENYDLINEDGEKFLSHVKKGKGEVKKIFEEIQKFGKLYDDISLLRISYKENLSETEETLPNKKITQEISKAESYLKTGNSEKAISLLNKILINEKPLPNLLYILGETYFNLKNYEKCLECLSMYNRMEPSNEEAIFMISNSFFKLKKIHEAAEYSERLYLRNKSHLQNLVLFSLILFELKQYSRSKLLYDQTLKIDPYNKEIQKLRKKFEESGEDLFDLAELNVGEISRKSPEDQKIELLLIADRLLKLKKWHDVLPYLKKALSFSTNDTDVLTKLGNVYYQIGDFEKAKSIWEKVSDIDPSNHQIINHLARLKNTVNQLDFKK